MSIQCKICDEGELKPSKVYYSTPVRVLGWILAVPGILWFAYCFIMFIAMGVGSASEEEAGAAAMVSSALCCMGSPGIITTLIGFILLRGKNALKCTECGAVINKE